MGAQTYLLVLGEIQGHMPCKLYKKHANELLVGAVIVLQQPAVLTLNFGESHYLILTANNLVQIYYPAKHTNTVNSVELENLAANELLELISLVEKHENNKDFSVNTIKKEQTVSENHLKTTQQPQTVAVINATKIEQQITTEKKKKFDFKVVNEQNSGDETLSQCSQIIIKSQNPAHDKILNKVFDGVDADSFFEDF